MKISRDIVLETMKLYYFANGDVFEDFDAQLGVRDEYDAKEVEKWLGHPGFADYLVSRSFS